MFEAHFGLRENPFSTSHDPRFVYPSPEHLEAVAHFRFGMQNHETFVLVTGEVGTGKTTAVQDLVSRLPQDSLVALIQNTALSRPELVEEICRRFTVEIDPGFSKPMMLDRLEKSLRDRSSRGEFCLLIVDEAQNLSREMLEEIRLLSNFELGSGKHFLICLVGQPELEQRLAQSDLRQLRQRISVKYRLQPLDEVECGRYLHHRLRVAGGDGERLFPAESIHLLYSITHGIPRENNIVAGQAMLNAYVEGAPYVGAEHVAQVLEEFSFKSVLSQEQGNDLSGGPTGVVNPPSAAPPPNSPTGRTQETSSFPAVPQRPAVTPPARPPEPEVVEPTETAPPSPYAPATPVAPAPAKPVQPPPPASPEPSPIETMPPAVEPVRPAVAENRPMEPDPAPVAPPSVPTFMQTGSSGTRSIADWKETPPTSSPSTSVQADVEPSSKWKEFGQRRVPAAAVWLLLVLILAVTLVATGVGRDLLNSVFPPNSSVSSEPEAQRVTEPPIAEPASEPVSPPTAPEPAGPKWVIQAASFRTLERAQSALALFRSTTGLEGKIVTGEGDYAGWHRVVLGSFPSADDATQKGLELSEQGHIPEDRFAVQFVP